MTHTGFGRIPIVACIVALAIASLLACSGEQRRDTAAGQTEETGGQTQGVASGPETGVSTGLEQEGTGTAEDASLSEPERSSAVDPRPDTPIEALSDPPEVLRSTVPPAELPPPGRRERAPEFALKDLSGREVKLSDFRGKIVILDFWATWCPPCRMEIPHFKSLYKDYKDRGVEIVGVALDRQGLRVVLPFVQQNGIPYVSLIGDGQVARLYGDVRNIPTTFVIDQDGRIVSRHVGFRPREVFETEIVALLEET